jgi:hypothetical protein
MADHFSTFQTSGLWAGCGRERNMELPSVEENGDANQNGESAPKKRDRWSKAPDPEPPENDSQKPAEGETNKKKSRWGTKQEPDPAPAAAGLALVPFGAPVVAAPGVSIVSFGTAAAAAAAGLAAAGAQVNPVNPEQLKVQLRIAEIQNLYNKPRFPFSLHFWSLFL